MTAGHCFEAGNGWRTIVKGIDNATPPLFVMALEQVTFFNKLDHGATRDNCALAV